MQTRKSSAFALGIALALSPVAWAGADAHDDAHHHHGDSYSAGEAGDPNQPARIIEVEMREMEYLPPKIEVKRGEQIRFVIHNTGTEAHEFLLATTEENLKHEAVMRKHPNMEHDEPNGLRIAAKQTGEILWKFSKPGTFEYACLIPDHREYGMTGKVIVK
jgi:uncharacterized cupredoxin-like copper-binding protein